MIDQELLDRNRDIQLWGKEQIGPMKSELRGLGVKTYTGALYRGLRDRYWRRDGKIRSIGFAMPRHGIFISKGVGRGYPVDAVMGSASGQTLSRKVQALKKRGYNNKAITRFLSTSDKLGAKQRKPKPWFNPVLDRSIPVLASTVAKRNADLIAKRVFIL